MFNAIAVTGNRVSFRNLKATLTALPNSTVALTFDDERQPTLIKSRREIESEFGKAFTLFRRGKPLRPRRSTYRLQTLMN